MTKSIEVQGRTEDEAIELALEQLGLSRDDVSVEIMETAKTGFLGLINTPAVVKVQYETDEADDTEEAEEAYDSTKATAISKKPKKATEKTIAVAVDSKVLESVNAFLEGLFKRMDLDVSLDISDKDGTINVIIKAGDPGVLIGRRGETLDALQHLTNYAINRGRVNRVKIHLDAENYRKRRSESLESLANRTASRVVKYRRNMTLDPMNAYERHIIHAALQDHEHVSTFSIGSESNRRVVIAYGQGKDNTERTQSQQYKEWS